MNSLSTQTLIACLGCLSLAAPLAATAEPLPPELAQSLHSIRVANKIPGMAIAIFSSDGRLQSGADGLRKAGLPKNVTGDDFWHLGSDTKAMTATLAGTFVAEGKLSWQDTMARLFPELAPKMDPQLGQVTVADLLHHRAGLIKDLSWAKFAAQGGSLQQQRRHVVRELLTNPPAYPVGSFHYSNAGFVLVGAILERISGKPWEQLITTRVFGPLDMKTAGFGGVGTPGLVDEPWGHEEDGQPVALNGPTADNPPVMGPAGTVHVSVEDWTKFLADQLRGAVGAQALLPPGIYAAIQTPSAGQDYAFGWGVARRPWAGGKVLTHNGSNTMNLAVCWLAPERQFGVLACANEAGPAAAKACDEAIQALIHSPFAASISRRTPLYQP
jgi:CubicO group peptidase (beta-lactamase class C family)